MQLTNTPDTLLDNTQWHKASSDDAHNSESSPCCKKSEFSDMLNTALNENNS